ncbi:hypothetical protein A3D71_03480 [Candidatus Kaiserbacteria bacterium RIFCSPHIGHO2_02_FULL_55_20]|uniref:Uncharacterized protein n=1 Tax=Candidatus Kaiserbacteria bacterium RIFCSPHIGHO2_02_FULL_55_20 TaxID=1798497 RepID=A0A1F6DV74_9BACT|nr:MAG: hypothetical protein A2680_04295 [Candidatus Kaiserbacteria bacterium RIFCSPHIGHO2_01_FULL_55_37]OGG65276.1 MAG: hypothetical protein A3D71_03480 [Candidatus Kaiserbacteria bacterium RIFCSPHIGHO2_02_FULL_55_20]
MRVTLEDAQQIAQKLTAATPSIHHVELFGSVLRDGSGNDADLVLIVDEDISRQWWTDMGHELRVRMGTRWLPLRRFIKTYLAWLDTMSIHGRKHRRIARASELLGVDIEKLATEYKSGMMLDIFLFPETWRTEKIPNTSVLCSLADVICNHEETRVFLERTARSAVRLV